MEHSDMRRMMQEALELKTGEVFEIIYHGGSSPGSRRTIMPLKVDKYTVYAKCFASDEEKTFRFDNMELAENSDAPAWQPFDHQKADTLPNEKKTGFLASAKEEYKKTKEPMSKKSIFFMALFFGLIAGYFFGYIGFIIVFCLFVYVGIDNNSKLKKKSVAPQTQVQTTVFAPTSTSGNTLSIDSQSTRSTDTNNLSSKTNFTSVPTPTTKTEARQMVKELETEEDVRNFVLSCEEAQDNLYDNHDLTEKQLDKLSDLLSDAMDLAEFKTLAWQFVPDASPQTPLEELKLAYKVFSNDEYKSLPKKFKQDNSWLELTIGDEPDLPDEFLANLIGFREIVESKLSDDQMITAIDNYLSEHPIFMEEYFGELDEDASLTHGQEWFASKLSQLGLPAAWELFAEGYTTIEKCLEIDPNEFIKRRGIGPKKKQQLIEFQEKHR
ncbi:hypothetical protein [Marinomonas aquiplantarum]|uniref:Helix-hairpin-helix protein n=1 Tax=Marinomonas aquiplantarum TaxID=491951 RepID=A0A366D022_9GAMM|nr:hypothetical protein [Marinomonas aquiplantarum]RBO83417.1 hypothetical protein DFP76_104236 [Marinomonas aquiplantarum]